MAEAARDHVTHRPGRKPRSASGVGRHLVIMAKVPVAGRVKTRLAREIGNVEAARFYRAMCRHGIARLAADRRWQSWIAISPDSGTDHPIFAGGARPIPQGPGDLGQRMQRIMTVLPPGPAIIVGTDIPEISAGAIALAFRRLGSADAVLGPAGDGGYWLVGLKRMPRLPDAFRAVRWSTPHALAETRANLEGLRVVEAPTLADVDSAIGYVRLAEAAQRRILPLAHRKWQT